MVSYLPADAQERLAAYVYRGEDHSYLYKHMWRPLCRSVVHHLPVWLAPNVITVLALVFVSLTHALLAYYMPKLTVKGEYFLARNETGRAAVVPFAKEFLPPPPAYVFVLAAVVLFLYQLLDNLDGHQARRTGTSSPLGLLMDHGCDAVNCIIGGLSVAAAVSAGPCWKTWLIVLNTIFVFLLNTWEEYYRGVLVLPVVNGPNEGILLAILVYLWTAWVGGPQWWYNHAIEVPASWLPAVLRQPPPKAALDVEAAVLRTVCPFLTRSADADEFAVLPFFFHLNCSASYRAHPPQPTRLSFAVDPLTARYEQAVLGKTWMGHGVLQKSVLRLYGSDGDVLRVRYNTIAVLLMTFGAALTSLGNLYQVYRAIRRTPATELEARFGSCRFAQRFPFLHALSRLVPLVVVTVMANVWFLTSQEDIFRRHPRLFCWTVGLLYTKLAIHLMLAHLCHTEFHSFRRTFVPFVLFGVHISLTYLHNVSQLHRQQLRQRQSHPAPSLWSSLSASSIHTFRSGLLGHVSDDLNATGAGGAHRSTYADYAYDLDEELILFEFFLLSVTTFVHLVWNAVRETAAVLQVPLFTVPYAKQMAVRASIAAERQDEAKAAPGPPLSTAVRKQR